MLGLCRDCGITSFNERRNLIENHSTGVTIMIRQQSTSKRILQATMPGNLKGSIGELLMLVVLA